MTIWKWGISESWSKAIKIQANPNEMKEYHNALIQDFYKKYEAILQKKQGENIRWAFDSEESFEMFLQQLSENIIMMHLGDDVKSLTEDSRMKFNSVMLFVRENNLFLFENIQELLEKVWWSDPLGYALDWLEQNHKSQEKLFEVKTLWSLTQFYEDFKERSWEVNGKNEAEDDLFLSGALQSLRALSLGDQVQSLPESIQAILLWKILPLIRLNKAFLLEKLKPAIDQQAWLAIQIDGQTTAEYDEEEVERIYMFLDNMK